MLDPHSSVVDFIHFLNGSGEEIRISFREIKRRERKREDRNERRFCSGTRYGMEDETLI